MNIFFPLILPLLIGLLASGLLLQKTKVCHKILLACSLAAPLGFGMISLILFFSYSTVAVYAPRLGFGIAWLALAALAVISVLNFRKSCPTQNWRSFCDPKLLGRPLFFINLAALLFFVYCLWRYLNYFAAETTYNPFGGWDARYMWAIKARFYVRDPELWRDLFIHPKPWWTLPDYPHLLPGSVAWGWLWLGREALGWPAVIGLAFFLSLASFLIWFVWSRHTFLTAVIGGSFLVSLPVYQFWSTTQYAEIPLCFFMTSSVFLALTAMERQESYLFVFSGLLAGLAAWTKNEGVLFIILCTALLSIFSLLKARDCFKKFIFMFPIGIILPLAAVFYLKTQLGGTGIYLSSPRTFTDYWKLITDPNRALFILVAFGAFAQTRDWLHLWQLGAASILALIGLKFLKQKLSHSVTFPITIVTLMLTGYFCIYLITPIELKFHIQFTMTRLLLHVGVVILAILPDIYCSRTK